MAKNNQVAMPNSGAGLTRYFDESQSRIRFKPGHVIILAFVVIFFIILLHQFGGNMLG